MKDIKELLSISLAKPDETIREHTDNLLKNVDTLRDLGYINQDIERLLRIVSEYHDYGKINERFQNRIKNGGRFDKEREIYHNLISPIFLKKELFKDEVDYYRAFYIIANHHNYCNLPEGLVDIREIVYEEYKDFGIERIKIGVISKSFDDEYDDRGDIVEDYKRDIVLGLLYKCDYSASGKFKIEYRNDFLEDGLKKLNYEWNELQRYTYENRDNNIIVVANTGMGKTEAGLRWIGNNKGFFILPLRTAINAIYKRMVENIITDDIEKRVVLVHSEAKNYLIENSKNVEEVDEYLKEGRNFSIPLTVTTLDQIFSFVFKYPGYELKLATLSYSKIIIDEIQAYSPDLLAYIARGLEMIRKAGGKFAILTATFPPFLKKLLNLEDIKYEKFVIGKDRHNIKVLKEELNIEFIIEHYLEKGKKVLVICNTVKKSQEVYEQIKEKIDDVQLLHSKFIKRDRGEKERKILDFGRTENIGEGIWISTSLVEASLDIDFDYLFTELNDLSGLFQRMGRVNRKGQKENYKWEPNVYLFSEIEKKLYRNGFIDETIHLLSKREIEGVEGILSEEKKYNLIEETLSYENMEKSKFKEEFDNCLNYIKGIHRGKFDKDKVKKEFRNIISYKAIPREIYNEYRDRIEEIIEKLENKNGDINRLKIEFDSFTINIGIYDLVKYTIIEVLGEKIYIVDGEYNKEIGFKRATKQNSSNEEIDIFI